VLGDRTVDVAVTTDRGRDRLRSYAIDPATGKLSDVTAANVPLALSSDRALSHFAMVDDPVDGAQDTDGAATDPTPLPGSPNGLLACRTRRTLRTSPVPTVNRARTRTSSSSTREC